MNPSYNSALHRLKYYTKCMKYDEMVHAVSLKNQALYGDDYEKNQHEKNPDILEKWKSLKGMGRDEALNKFAKYTNEMVNKYDCFNNDIYDKMNDKN